MSDLRVNNNQEAFFDEIWRLFKETDAKFKETDAKFEQAVREQKERSIELDKRFAETRALIKKTHEEFNTQWGKLMESLVEGDIVRLLQDKGIAINRTSTRVKGSYNGFNYEFDIIAHNGDEIVILEVKTSLSVKKVKSFIEKLNHVKTWFSEYKNHRVYGAVAYLRSDENSEIFSENKGLFVIKATGDSASIINGEDFEPKEF